MPSSQDPTSSSGNNTQASNIHALIESAPPSTNEPDETSNATNAKTSMKRKVMKLRSRVWDHFEKIKDENGAFTKAKCLHCLKDFASHSKRNGTSSLKQHMESCMKNPYNQDTRQALLNLQPNNGEEVNSRMGTLSSWKFDQNEIREAITYMIIIDKLPFKFVEGVGFKRVMSKACPRFEMPSRWTVSHDCYQLYLDERMKLHSFLRNSCQRVSLTTDTWTSLQGINYMCITAHFIDNDQNLHKKVLNFVPVTSHKGDYIGKAVETCVLEWGLRNMFTIIIDNASSNDTTIAFLKKRMLNWGGSVADCKYLHMRCIAHIINLVVSEGMKDVNPSIQRVRDVVRYIRNSLARLRYLRSVLNWKGLNARMHCVWMLPQGGIPPI